MRFALVHARAMTLELVRHPAYVVPTLVFPAVFFLFFAASGAGPLATVRMAAFAGFAVIGVSFFQFGVGIAVERGTPWEMYLRTLPLSVGWRLAARLVSASAFATAAAAIVVAVAAATTPVELRPARLAALAGALVLGTIPFALLGIALGYWAPARGALPIANLLYLGLSYAGGLWFRPHDLPREVACVSPYVPTRALERVLTDAVQGATFPTSAWLELGGFSAVFAAVAWWGYQRDEGRRFR